MTPQADLERSLAAIKPTVNQAELHRQEEFTRDFGEEG
jgi:hypothetical protein